MRRLLASNSALASSILVLIGVVTWAIISSSTDKIVEPRVFIAPPFPRDSIAEPALRQSPTSKPTHRAGLATQPATVAPRAPRTPRAGRRPRRSGHVTPRRPPRSSPKRSKRPRPPTPAAPPPSTPPPAPPAPGPTCLTVPAPVTVTTPLLDINRCP